MKYVTGNYESMESAALLMELNKWQQVGFPGEVHVLEIREELQARKEAKPIPEITVWYEFDYRWTVDVSGEDESRTTGLTKREAMDLARSIKRKEFGGNAIIDEQKLSKQERKANISWLHEHGYSYTKF